MDCCKHYTFSIPSTDGIELIDSLSNPLLYARSTRNVVTEQEMQQVINTEVTYSKYINIEFNHLSISTISSNLGQINYTFFNYNI